MDISIDSISTIKVENDNKIKKNNEFQVEAKNKEDDFNFEKSFELSKIEILDEIYKQKTDDEVNNINDISDYSFDKENNKKNSKEKKIKKKKKIKKEELNNIPLPIFSCIFCCNEIVSFRHLSNEIISNKYLFQTSIYDIKQLDFLISGKINKKIDNDKLLDIILNNFENIKEFINGDKINNFFKSKKFKTRCEYNKLLIKNKFRTKFEEKVNKKKKDFYFKEIKGTYKISKNSLNNKCLFNTNSLINNYSSLAGLIPKESELIHNLAEKQNNSITSSHLSNINIHGNMNKNEIGLIGKDNNKHYVENIVEKIDKNVESDIFDFLGENDLKRKINKKDIEWEDTYYDINNPIIKDYEINNQLFLEEDNILEIINQRDNKNKNNHNKNIYNKHNTINNIKSITINSENKSNIKMSIFNNSKSLASTNTSSNIIMKDKENKTLSIFINKNKMLNIENNSALSPRHKNIILKNLTKSSKKDVESNRFKKIFGNGNSFLDLKNIHKKISFNHTLNIYRDLNECSNIKNKHINRDIVLSNLNIKEKNLLDYNIDKNMNKINNYKYKLILDNNKKNEILNNNNTFEKIMKRFKSNKYNKNNFVYNSVFKFTKDKEKPFMKSPINNIKYSVIHSYKSQKINKLNIFNLKKKDLNIKTENEYLNNFISPKPNIKVNNIFEKQFITDNNINDNMKYKRKLNVYKNDIRIIS
jgi:hypothetical protein